MEATKFSEKSGDLSVVIYPGDNKILIAMSLENDAVNDTDKNLAGFAIWRKYDGKPEEILQNRIGFTVGVNNQTTAETREWTDSDKAPFQKFRWIDVPPDGFDTGITYRVQALYFTGQGVNDQARRRGDRCRQTGATELCQIRAGVYPRLHRFPGLYR